MKKDLISTAPKVSPEQQALDALSKDATSEADRKVLEEFQKELDADRASTGFEGKQTEPVPTDNALHVDASGVVLTPDEIKDQLQRRQKGNFDEYGHGGPRA